MPCNEPSLPCKRLLLRKAGALSMFFSTQGLLFFLHVYRRTSVTPSNQAPSPLGRAQGVRRYRYVLPKDGRHVNAGQGLDMQCADAALINTSTMVCSVPPVHCCQLSH